MRSDTILRSDDAPVSVLTFGDTSDGTDHASRHEHDVLVRDEELRHQPPVGADVGEAVHGGGAALHAARVGCDLRQGRLQVRQQQGCDVHVGGGEAEVQGRGGLWVDRMRAGGRGGGGGVKGSGRLVGRGGGG